MLDKRSEVSVEIKVESESRLDVFLVAHVPHMSRAKASALAEDGKVRINGHRARKGARVAPGDVVRIDELPTPSDFTPVASASLELSVLYEDPQLVVVDKPAGMPTHPLVPEEHDTLVNALVARYPEMVGVGYRSREPGIVHRLDTDTSGVVLAARDERTFEALRDALRDGRIEKTYFALVEGHPSAPRTIDAPIVPHPKDRKKVKVLDPLDMSEGKPAYTHLETSEAFGDFSLLRVHAPRAGRHQVRAHLSSIGHPLVGDLLYGGPAHPELKRHFLHAATIAFQHPKTSKRVEVESALPPDLAAILAKKS